jgi:putative ATP-dependent endonuclease of OLD family
MLNAFLEDGKFKHKYLPFSDVSDSTKEYFEKLAGYDTLRFLLCEKAILVEGPSDELIVQRAYMDLHDGRLPIDDCIDVISVGISFLRFLELAAKLGKQTAVVTDNDGDVEKLKTKYNDYFGDEQKECIEIFFDKKVDVIDNARDGLRANTLEPKLLKENTLTAFNTLFKRTDPTAQDMIWYMEHNKTDYALVIFNSDVKIKYPEYILGAISWCETKRENCPQIVEDVGHE